MPVVNQTGLQVIFTVVPVVPPKLNRLPQGLTLGVAAFGLVMAAASSLLPDPYAFAFLGLGLALGGVLGFIGLRSLKSTRIDCSGFFVRGQGPHQLEPWAYSRCPRQFEPEADVTFTLLAAEGSITLPPLRVPRPRCLVALEEDSGREAQPALYKQPLVDVRGEGFRARAYPF